MQDWLNRIGLTLQFVAVFLVTPEILGKERVGRFANRAWISPFSRYRAFLKRNEDPIWITITVITVPTFIALLFSLLWKYNANGWWLLVALIAFYTVPLALVKLYGGISKPLGRLAEKMIASSTSFLWIGAFIFALGYVLLMSATWVHPD